MNSSSCSSSSESEEDSYPDPPEQVLSVHRPAEIYRAPCSNCDSDTEACRLMTIAISSSSPNMACIIMLGKMLKGLGTAASHLPACSVEFLTWQVVAHSLWAMQVDARDFSQATVNRHQHYFPWLNGRWYAPPSKSEAITVCNRRIESRSATSFYTSLHLCTQFERSSDQLSTTQPTTALQMLYAQRMGSGDPLLPPSVDSAYSQYKSSARTLQAELAITRIGGPFPTDNQAYIYVLMDDMHFASICLQALRMGTLQIQTEPSPPMDFPVPPGLPAAARTLQMLKCRSLFPTIRDDLHHHVRHLTISAVRDQVA